MSINFTAHAQAVDWTIANRCVAGPDADVATIQGVKCLIINLIQIIAPLVAFSMVGVIIFAGIKMILGADNPKEVASAKTMLGLAIVGLIGIAGAWIILVLIQVFTGATVTELQVVVDP